MKAKISIDPDTRSLSIKQLIFRSLFIDNRVSFCTPSKNIVAPQMTRPQFPQSLARRNLFYFVRLVLKTVLKMGALMLFPSKNASALTDLFADLYSKLWGFAEHSISHQAFNLPSALGSGPTHKVNELLCELYGSQFSSLSFGGSSGAMLTLLTAVFPKLYPHRDLILFDEICHQSAIGGLIFGRWTAIRLPRNKHAGSQTVCPVKFESVKTLVERHGPENFAAIVLVLPSYDGFRSPLEDEKIYQYARSVGIPVILDGAWDGLRFFNPETDKSPLSSICDVWITSPHKRGLTPSPLGCILTHNETIAQLWDNALDLGFRSSSVSFVNIMIAEHRLSSILSGQWDDSFKKARQAAQLFRECISEIHPDLEVIAPSDIQAETHDPTHVLISTQNIPHLDARDWASVLSNNFAIDVEKATATSLLLLCGSPFSLARIEEITSEFDAALRMTLGTAKVTKNDT